MSDHLDYVCVNRVRGCLHSSHLLLQSLGACLWGMFSKLFVSLVIK